MSKVAWIGAILMIVLAFAIGVKSDNAEKPPAWTHAMTVQLNPKLRDDESPLDYAQRVADHFRNTAEEADAHGWQLISTEQVSIKGSDLIYYYWRRPADTSSD